MPIYNLEDPNDLDVKLIVCFFFFTVLLKGNENIK